MRETPLMNTGTADKPEFQPPPPLDKSTRERETTSLSRDLTRGGGG